MTQPPPAAPQQQVYYVQRRKPSYPVTWVLLAINVVVFVAEYTVAGFLDQVVLTYTATRTQPWRLITSAFVHFGIFHIVLNMFALYMLGRPLELVLGRVKYLTLYLLSALGGSALFLVFANPGLVPFQEPAAGGASGAIFGLFGALVVLQRYRVINAGNLIPILAFNLALSFLIPGIGWQAHIGGLIIGAGVAWAFMRGLRRETSTRTMWTEVALIGALVAATIIAGYTLLA